MRKSTLPYRHGSLMTPIAVVLCYFVVLSLMQLGLVKLRLAARLRVLSTGCPNTPTRKFRPRAIIWLLE